MGGGGTNDGPFRYLRHNYVDKKKHFHEVLVFGNVPKLLDTAQDVLNEPERELPPKFWEVMTKRCVQSMHLFEPLELAIIARLFDVHQSELRSGLDIYGHIATHAQGARDIPGHAILVLVDVLSRRLRSKAKLRDVIGHLGRRAADVLWQLSAPHAVMVLEALSNAKLHDPALCSRVAAKVAAQLQATDIFQLEDVARTVTTFAGQGYRDLALLRDLGQRAAGLCDDSPLAAEAARQVVDGFASLGIEELPAALQAAADAAASDATPEMS